MATKIVTKNSSTASAVPTASDLVQGELAVNVADKRLFTEDNGGSIVELGTNPSTLTVTGEITANGGIDVTGTASADQLSSKNGKLFLDDNGSHNGVINAPASLYVNFDSDNNSASEKVVFGYDRDSTSGGTSVMEINSTGIDVDGTATFNSGNENVVATFTSTDTEAQINLVDSTGSAQIRSRNDLRFFVNGGSTRAMDIGSSGDISFYEDTGTTAKFFWDASAESLGLSNSSPSSTYSIDALKPLRVKGTAPSYELEETDSSNQRWSLFGLGGNFTLRDISNGTYPITVESGTPNNTLYLDDSGNVGIGTSSPDTALEVKGDGSSVQVSSADYDVALLGRRGSSGTDLDKGYMRLRDTGTTKVAIDSAGNTYFNGGNVGIGTSSPSYPFHLSGSGDTVAAVTAGASSIAALNLGNSTNLADGGIRYDNSANALIFRASNTERMRIDSSGNVGIGTSSPDAKLVVSKGGSTAAHGDSDLLVRDSSASGSTAQVQILGGNAAYSNLYFSDTDSYSVGGFQYNHSSNYLSTRVNNAEAMRIDSSGNVGIGTSSPNTPLQVSGGNSSTNADALFSIQKTTEGYGLFGGVLPNGASWLQGGTSNDATDYSIVLQPNGGNVGIGTNSPTGLLELSANNGSVADLSQSLRITNGSYTAGTYAGVLFQTADTLNSFIAAERVAGYAGILKFAVNAGANANDLQESMRIDSAGNVGIGTSSPSSYLAEGSNLVVADSSHTGITLASGASSEGGIFFADGTSGADRYRGIIRYNHSSDYMEFRTDATERMRINSSGSLLVGSSSFSFAGSNDCVQISGTEGRINIENDTASTAYALAFYNTNGLVGRISTSGSATSYVTSSDYRLKEDWQPVENATDRLKELKPCNFAWKADGSRVDGFLAHELQEVVPEAVTGEKDAMTTEEYEVTPAVYEDVVIPATEEVLDEEGNVITEAQEERTEQQLVSEAVMGEREVPDYQGIDQSKLVPLLVATIQELEARITQLENN